MKISSYTVTLLSVFLVLAACGGGGGTDTNGTPQLLIQIPNQKRF